MDKGKIKKFLNDLWNFVRKYAPWLIILASIIETAIGYHGAWHVIQKITIGIDVIVIICAVIYAVELKERKTQGFGWMMCLLWFIFKTIWAIGILW